MLSSPNVNAVKKNFFFNLRSKNQTSFTYKYMLTHVFWFLLLCTIITYNHLFEMSKNVLRGRILSLILCAIFFLYHQYSILLFILFSYFLYYYYFKNNNVLLFIYSWRGNAAHVQRSDSALWDFQEIWAVGSCSIFF